MNAVAKEVALKINAGRLVNHLRLAFTSATTYLAELMQNARRAGASRVSFIYEPKAARLTVVDDGSGITDLQNLLTVAESGWDKDVMESEHPYGMGFLSALFAARRVTVSSQGHQLAFDTDKALSFESIPVTQSSVLEGTTLVLEGIDADPEMALKAYAKGFPIPVFYNDKELERPHALDSGLVFENHPEGKFFFRDIDQALASYVGSSGTGALEVYLQGLPVYRSRWCQDANIVHLNPEQFHGRLPDRDNLINEDDAISRLNAVVRTRWGRRLTELAMSEAAELFARRAYATLDTWGQLGLLNRNPYLPAEVLGVASQYPVENNDWENDYTAVKRPVHRSLVESGTVRIITEDDVNRYEEGPFQAAMYLYAHKSLVLNGRLDDGHWVHQAATSITDDDIEMEVIGPVQCAKYNGSWAWGRNVLFCEKAVLHGPLGPMEIEEAFYFSGDTLRNPEGIPEKYRESVIVVPSTEGSGQVVRQISNFISDDHFDENGADEEDDMFSRFILSNKPGNEAAILAQLLYKANADSYDALKGKCFTVVISNDPECLYGERVKVELA